MTSTENYSEHLLRGGHGPLAWQRLARFRYAAKVIRELRPGAVPTIVDIGAADGIALPFIRPLATRLVSMNYYPAHSREFLESHPDEICVTADARQLPLETGSVDVVVSFETLHLIPGRSDRLTALGEIARVLCPKGLFVCSVPVETGHVAFQKYLARLVTKNQLEGMTIRRMLMHCLHPVCNVGHLDQGRQVGFDAYRFSADVAKFMKRLSRRTVPIPVAFPTNLVTVAERQ